ncbi:uncharacterized protein Z520_06915 [Fonsecaea multimorphosa CBS 102226]|uniref:Peptidase S54 rhomboid domain-containing protein n=1 Tax=Fonsecaea multimorphosa CBS 102226 TaxID=1442371 RepID=A0A0D2KLF6_9EURO|nr:uncharacterized protein Z520_06915 [Fonsecaea multimorphosa CBS 102226]KIX97463.1 hypothetical protein Z520_06915 [Fonsecaea multimorphosa CBS 102226]OAL23427.1 hypothetical protein AYO22_06477 [Fonsecaea multimorphosa]
MVTTSGFSHTPVARLLILTSVGLSILVSTLSIQYLLPIRPHPHLWPYLQFSRLLTYQAAHTTSTELLFSAVLLYQFRVLERIWGSRKFASFVAVVFWCNVLVAPLLLLLLKLVTLGWYNYLPSGSTGLVFALLSAWADEVPRLYRYKIATTGSPATTGGHSGRQQQQHQHQQVPGVVLSDKSTTYLLAAQLALSQFPYSIMPAAVGWTVGTAWMGELLPGGLGRWRIPAWMVGESSRRKERDRYEGLRRRLEEEGGSADGMRTVSDRIGAAAGGEQESRRRGGFGRQILGYFTGSS